MKKLLKLMTGLSLITSTSLVVSCGRNWMDYVEIERPAPVNAITQNGFVNFLGSQINVNQFSYTYDLIDEIKNQLTIGGYNLENLEWSVVRNRMILEDGLNDNLLRNGLYVFRITNPEVPGDFINVEQTITNSKFLPDVISTTNLRDIPDNRVKTILLELIFNNLMSLLNRVDDIADEMLGNDSIVPGEDSVHLDFGEFDRDNRDRFYGEITLTYNVVGFTPSWEGGPITVEQLAGIGPNGSLRTHFGTLSGRITPFQLMTQFITFNFSTSRDYWFILINDFDIDNIRIVRDTPEGNDYTATINTFPQPNEEEPKVYLTGEIVLTFRYFGNDDITTNN